MVPVVVEADMGTCGDTAREVLQPFEQVGFGLDERCGRHEALGLGDGVDQGLGIHAASASTVQYWTGLVEF